MKLDARLTRLEAADQERQARVYARVMAYLIDGDLDTLSVVVGRHNAAILAGEDFTVSDDEKRVLCQVESLTLRDLEMRPADLMNMPHEWMQETGYALP